MEEKYDYKCTVITNVLSSQTVATNLKFMSKPMCIAKLLAKVE